MTRPSMLPTVSRPKTPRRCCPVPDLLRERALWVQDDVCALRAASTIERLLRRRVSDLCAPLAGICEVMPCQRPDCAFDPKRKKGEPKP